MFEIPRRKIVTYELVGAVYGGILRAGIYRDIITGDEFRREVKVNETLPKTIERLNLI